MRETRPRLAVWFVVLFAFTGAASADVPPARGRMLMDRGWRFHLGDPDGVNPAAFDAVESADGKRADGDDFGGQVGSAKAKPDDFERDAELAKRRIDPVATNVGGTLPVVSADFDDRDWRPVELPHDWAVELPFDPKGDVSHGFKRMGGSLGNTVGWYRRSFTLPAADKGKAVAVAFDGVYRNSLVWLNGHCLGRNVSGYSSFAYDLNRYANFGGRNELVVRVDAGRNEGWWYEGAGIYRHVWLWEQEAVHADRDGPFVTADVAATGTATVTIRTRVYSPDMTATAKLTSTVADPDGRVVAQVTTDRVTADGSEVVQRVVFPAARLWSPESPNLYNVETDVTAGKAIDFGRTSFGIRTTRFDPDQGFFLNGKHVFLQGTCNHQDHAGVGVAIPDSVNEWRLRRLKEMGCNAVRMSHNPPTPELLDQCDRLGLLVMDETRKSGRTPELLDQLARMVRRDRNHPSVILWSIGNEENGIQGTPVGATVAKAMRDAILGLDDTRPVTAAMNGGWGGGFSTVLDVQGFNYPLNTDVAKYHEAHPRQPLLASEEGSTVTTRGEYADDPAKGYVTAYDTEAPSWAVTAEAWVQKYRRDWPFMAGAFVWTGFDYRGEPTPYAWPCVNSHFGLIDTCGFAKDEFYYYQSVWTEKPMVHLLPHWNWAGREGQDVAVWAYSNAGEVELLQDGRSLGREVVPAGGHVAWQVPYHAGTLTARAYRNSRLVATDTVQTTGPAAKLVLGTDGPALRADGEDVAVFTVAVTDAQGRTVPTAGDLVRFTVEGGTNVGVGNGDPSCHEPDHASQRSAFHGRCCVLVRAGTRPGPVVVTASADGLEPATLTVDAAAATPRAAVP